MLLNHKYAVTFVNENSKKFKKLNIAYIEQIHSLLVQNLGVAKNLRKTLVRITGTEYKPLDNEYQVREAMVKMCELINNKSNVYEKAFLCILLISYIQPFEDGNKRTSRVLGNSILLSSNTFPLSYRSVDIDEYKKAKLLFYETNNISAFKKIFISQAQYAVKNYFRVRG